MSYDPCEVGRDGAAPVAVVPLAVDGRARVDERGVACTLLVAIIAGADLSTTATFATTDAVVATRSKAGKRLFLEFDDGAFATNVLEHLDGI